jgi:hypothetical protein
MSFLSGLFDMTEAINDPDRFFSRWTGRLAHSLTPFAGAQRTVRDFLDPVTRKPETFAEVFASNVPGLSTNVPPRVSRRGEIVTRPGGPVRRAADPLNVSEGIADPIDQELARLGISPTSPDADRLRVNGERYQWTDAKQRTIFEQASGLTRYRAVERFMQRQSYRGMPDERKTARLRGELQRAANEVTMRAQRLIRRGQPLTLEALLPASARQAPEVNQ